MTTRRNVLKGAVAAALAAQPARNASAIAEKPQLFGRALYGPHHPLAQGETAIIPPAPEKPIMAMEEISRRTLHNADRMFVHKDAGAADLLRARLDEEVSRWSAAAWSGYKHELRKIEQLLHDAGVDGETVKWAIDDLDVAAVGLFTEGHCSMLEVGIEAGKCLARDVEPSTLILPGDRTCKTCHGGGGMAHDCATCDGTGLVDEPGPGLMLIVIPDGVALEGTETEVTAAAA